MKKILAAAVTFMVTANVNAQTGMPQALTCTERAFNFSFSVGTKWKFSAPKMGPVEAAKDVPGYIPAWSLKHFHAVADSYLLPSVEKLFNVEALRNPFGPQSYSPLSNQNTFSLMDKPKFLLPGINPAPSITYMVLWPNFLVKPTGNNP